MINRFTIFLFFFSIGYFSLYANPLLNQERHKEFINKSLDIDHFTLFFQDSIGRLWGGSYSNGLMMFDGSSFVKKASEMSYEIRCVHPITYSEYLVGTKGGLYLFDMKLMTTTLIPDFTYDNVVGLHRVGDKKFLIFCSYKIAELDIETYNVNVLSSWDYNSQLNMHQISHDGSIILLSNFHEVYIYRYPNKTKELLIHSDSFIKDELLLCILRDDAYLWIGSDRGLIKYNYATNKIDRVPGMEGITVKTLMKAKNGDIWVGTDNGLYVFDKKAEKWDHYQHNNQNERSLLSNCVWSIFEDIYENKWIGVDGGVSFIPHQSSFFTIKWNDFIQTNEGNRIVQILHDDHGDYWLGGINGLGYYKSSTGQSIFFRMQGISKIPNNRIRTVYEDKHGVIWIGTDGGPAWYNKEKGDFIFCPIEDKLSGRNAIWTYGITEDNYGNMWFATGSGGLFAVNRKELMNSRETVTQSWCNFHTDSPSHKLQSNNCTHIDSDPLGNIWFSTEKEIYKLEFTSNQDTIQDFNLLCISYNGTKAFIRNDWKELWGINDNGFFKIDFKTSMLEQITTDYTEKYSDINSMAICDDNLWFVTSSGVKVMNLKTKNISHILDFSNSLYKSCYYDKKNNLIWLGGVNQCLALNPKECLASKPEIYRLSIISEAYANGKPQEIAFTNHIELSPQENNLSFRFSNGVLVRETELQSGYYYRMKGIDDSWKAINVHHPLVEYSYLTYGKYSLEVGHLNESGEMENIRTLDITILPPWYHTIWFRLIIILIVATLILVGLNFYRTKTKLRIAEIDKEKTLKLSQMKMEFLTNMSHELKTPLSLIMGPVNKLLSTTKSSQSKALLLNIQESAMQLNSLILQIIKFKDDSSVSDGLNLTRLEVVEFMKSIISAHQEIFASKKITIELHINKTEIFIEADLLKLESIVNNLISNSYKFTPEGGKVIVSLDLFDKDDSPHTSISVTDNGIGIPAEDIPYIFDRFYQSEQNQTINKDGSGIGLSMVKKYIQQHGGDIQVTSGSTGTTFTITMPALDNNLSEGITNSTITSPGIDEIYHQKLHILIVEDNLDIADFIANNLKGMKCTIAHNGRSGLEQAQQLLPDVIVADIMMPVMDGIEMSRLIRRNVATSTIPIILLTAKDNEHTETDAYKIGVDVFLSKPFDINHLITRINQLVRNKTKLTEQLRNTEAMQIKEVEVVQSQDEKFLTIITQTIEEYLEDPDLNIQKLSEISGYHHKLIYRRIKALTGNTTVDYIKSIRLKKAAMLLAQKKFSVAEVMYMVGFSTHSYFSKCFTEKYGKSPKVYMDEVNI